MSFASEMSAWFDTMHALAPAAVTFGAFTAPAVMDEQTAADQLIPGGIQGTVEGAVFVRRADFASAPPTAGKPVSVNGTHARVLTTLGEPSDPILRVVYGKL